MNTSGVDLSQDFYEPKADRIGEFVAAYREQAGRYRAQGRHLCWSSDELTAEYRIVLDVQAIVEHDRGM